MTNTHIEINEKSQGKETAVTVLFVPLHEDYTLTHTHTDAHRGELRCFPLSIQAVDYL